MAKCSITPFLIGALYGHLTLNGQNHAKRGLTITLPVTKKWLARELKALYGGSVYSKYTKGYCTICYTMRAAKSMEKLRSHLLKYAHHDVHIASLCTVLGKPNDTYIKNISAKRNKGRPHGVTGPIG